jgi:hypothetical protein
VSATTLVNFLSWSSWLSFVAADGSAVAVLMIQEVDVSRKRSLASAASASKRIIFMARRHRAHERSHRLSRTAISA